MSNNDQEYRVVDGVKVPVMPAKATVTVKHKRTGKHPTFYILHPS